MAFSLALSLVPLVGVAIALLATALFLVWAYVISWVLPLGGVLLAGPARRRAATGAGGRSG